MNALTASFIVIVIGAAAFIVAAWLTARSRIGVLPAKTVQVPSGSSRLGRVCRKQAKQYRVFGWILVVLLYLLAVFCLLQGVQRASRRPPLARVASLVRQCPERPSANRALFPILDRAGDRALFYRVLGAAQFAAARLGCALKKKRGKEIA